MVFHRNFIDNKFPQVSRTVLSILAVLNNIVVWMVSTRHLISKSSSPWINLLVTVPRAPITIGINVTFMFHSFFNSQTRSWYLSFFSLSFNLTRRSAGIANSTILYILSFNIIRPGGLAEIRWSVGISKSQRSLYVSFSKTDATLCIYCLFVLSNFNFLHSSQWITLPSQLSYTLSVLIYCIRLLMLLILSSLWPHNLHLLFCCVLSILGLIWLVLMALFSLLGFSFFNISTYYCVRCCLLVT